jgi:hypothetical protein
MFHPNIAIVAFPVRSAPPVALLLASLGPTRVQYRPLLRTQNFD